MGAVRLGRGDPVRSCAGSRDGVKEVSDCHVIGGDSGSPVFSGHYALGIMDAGGTCDQYYTPGRAESPADRVDRESRAYLSLGAAFLNGPRSGLAWRQLSRS